MWWAGCSCLRQYWCKCDENCNDEKNNFSLKIQITIKKDQYNLHCCWTFIESQIFSLNNPPLMSLSGGNLDVGKKGHRWKADARKKAGWGKFYPIGDADWFLSIFLAIFLNFWFLSLFLSIFLIFLHPHSPSSSFLSCRRDLPIWGTKGATGDLLVLKRWDFLGLFRFLCKPCMQPERPKGAKYGGPLDFYIYFYMSENYAAKNLPELISANWNVIGQTRRSGAFDTALWGYPL